MISYELGQIVKSSAGRDKGELFIIVALDDVNLYLSDGKNRRLESLKKKKKKHVQITHMIADAVSTKLHHSDKITNADIRNGLKEFRHNLD